MCFVVSYLLSPGQLTFLLLVRRESTYKVKRSMKAIKVVVGERQNIKRALLRERQEAAKQEAWQKRREEKEVSRFDSFVPGTLFSCFLTGSGVGTKCTSRVMISKRRGYVAVFHRQVSKSQL